MHRAPTRTQLLRDCGATARALTDVIEAGRATGLEIAVVALIVTEVLLTLAQTLFFHHA